MFFGIFLLFTIQLPSGFPQHDARIRFITEMQHRHRRDSTALCNNTKMTLIRADSYRCLVQTPPKRLMSGGASLHINIFSSDTSEKVQLFASSSSSSRTCHQSPSPSLSSLSVLVKLLPRGPREEKFC